MRRDIGVWLAMLVAVILLLVFAYLFLPPPVSVVVVPETPLTIAATPGPTPAAAATPVASSATRPVTLVMQGRDVVSLLTAPLWPIVVIAALFFLRQPLRELLKNPARWLKSVSVLGVEVAFPELEPAGVSWSAPGLPDVRNLSGAQAFDSGAVEIMSQLTGSAKADYVLIDLGTGKRWLTSRLHIFSLMLHRMSGFRYLVFVREARDERHQFVGIAHPLKVRWALASRYPWLEAAYAEAYANVSKQFALQITSHDGAIPEYIGGALLQSYLEHIQTRLHLSYDQLTEPKLFLSALRSGHEPLTTHLRSQLSADTRALLDMSARSEPPELYSALMDDLNRVLRRPDLYDRARVARSLEWMDALFRRDPQGDDLTLLNRHVLEASYTDMLTPTKIEIQSPDGKLIPLEREWVHLRNTDDTWEHAQWIDDRLIEDLLGVDLSRDPIRASDLQALPREAQQRRILTLQGSTVAVVDDRGRFTRVIDRQGLVEHTAREVAQAGPNGQ